MNAQLKKSTKFVPVEGLKASQQLVTKSFTNIKEENDEEEKTESIIQYNISAVKNPTASIPP
eukprot:CAMPEP_0170568204 /NCGR_PEP_ID=MMETSP0211-20121228/81009_1 /TAXON_ID=311385 /ORGANISM="Pseudokeronopsis sp., Strain OXSARD2" /LENGTH=61 /DNA_ID=CAMNT_0010889957 /DNA_START=66 /DNA_END=251 /DNA_ORIENTATION=-